MERSIVHMDLDTFFVSVERLLNPKLTHKPVIIGGVSDRGVVASCSYETRKHGVSSAMPMKMAKYLCPDAIVIKGDMDAYSKYSDLVTEIIEEAAPVFEKASIDEHYIDVSGMDKFVGCFKWSKELRRRIMKETGLPISFGLSTNKTVSKIATSVAKPGELKIDRPMVKPFLNPLSIKMIPGIGKKNYRLLRIMGISSIGHLSLIPQDVMINVMGKNGGELWDKANGIDQTPVHAYTRQKSISTERTFDKDTIDMIRLNQELVSMAEKLGYELRKSKRLTACVTVKIKYTNFDTHTQQRRIPYTSFDHHIAAVAKELFIKVYNRRMRLRLIGLKLSHLIHGEQQLDLFNDTQQLIDLYTACDNIKHKFGKYAITRSITV